MKQIRRVVNDINVKQSRTVQAMTLGNANSHTVTESAPRSSNLRLKKTFSDFDRDQFCQSSFQFIAKYFETSLAELKKRNPGIDVQYRPIDANSFTATIYESGSRKSYCAIDLGTSSIGGRGITYTTNAPTRGMNSYNEMLTIEADDQSMYLKSIGMWAFSNKADTNLSQEGAAEAFWRLLIRPLQ